MLFSAEPPPSQTFDLDEEGVSLKQLQTDDPVEFARILAFNSELVELAERADVEALTRHMQGRGSIRVLYWHLVKACKAAALTFRLPTLCFLIEFGLDLSHCAFKGLLPCLAASEYPSEELLVGVIEKLLEAGLSIHDTEGEQFCTALHVACMRDDVLLVRVLLEHEADANAINRRRLMPLNLASSEEVVRALKSYGAVGSWLEDLPNHC